MARVYKSICMEIDELTIQIMHLAEKLVEYKLEVENIVNNGFVNIAKARYIMGSRCVSTLQLPTQNSNPILPLVTVYKDKHEGYWIFKSSRKKPSPLPSEEGQLQQKLKTESTGVQNIKDKFGKDLKNIRKRKEFYLVEDGNYKDLNEELQDEVTSSESEESLVTFTDPIRLFGVLVPQTLKIAQKKFQDAVDVLLQCATTQSKIDSILKRYHHLKNIKQMIESVSEDRGFDLTEEKNYWTPSDVLSETSGTVKVVSAPSTPEENEVESQGKKKDGESVESKIEIVNEGEGEDEEHFIASTSSLENLSSKCDENSENLEKLSVSKGVS